jgi:hypothetical protein
MRVLRPLGKALAIVLGLFLALGLLLPRAWRVERDLVIAAPPDRIAPLVLSLRRWQSWSPWTTASDPQAVHSYQGPESGVGAQWSWKGPRVGQGRRTITASAATAVTLEEALESDRPNAIAEFTFTPEGQGTRVRWREEGELPLLGGYFRPRLETSMGGHFEQGLARLKALAETP